MVSKAGTKNTIIKKSSPSPSARSKLPAIGDLAPDFAIPSDTHGLVSLSKFRGKKIVLYFYPKDNTPGCTKQACAFQESLKGFAKEDSIVIGVSPDSIVSHEKFRTKYALDFILLSDDGHKVAEAFGVWVEKMNYGRKYMGVQRSTFLIDRQGCVAHVWPKVSVEGHAAEVLKQLKSI